MINIQQMPACPVALFLKLVGNKWKVLIIRDLLTATKRFGELKRSVGCSQKVLTDNLRALEEDGFITRKIYAEIPPRVEYSLTETGFSLQPVLNAIAVWGSAYRQKRTGK